MNVSIKPVLRTDKINKSNRAPIHIRFTQNRQKKHISTGISINVEDWDCDNQRIISNSNDSKALQFQIDDQVHRYLKKIRRLEALDIEVNFNTLFEAKGHRLIISIEDAFNKEVERLESLGKINSSSKHKHVLSALSAYKPTKIYRLTTQIMRIDYWKP